MSYFVAHLTGNGRKSGVQWTEEVSRAGLPEELFGGPRAWIRGPRTVQSSPNYRYGEGLPETMWNLGF